MEFLRSGIKLVHASIHAIADPDVTCPINNQMGGTHRRAVFTPMCIVSDSPGFGVQLAERAFRRNIVRNPNVTLLVHLDIMDGAGFVPRWSSQRPVGAVIDHQVPRQVSRRDVVLGNHNLS